jgi:uncharacterized RDD family membrane protein YckC
LVCRLLILVVLLAAAVARGEVVATALHVVGEPGGQVVAVTIQRPSRDEPGRNLLGTDILRRPAGAGLDAWQPVASYTRPMVAMASLGPGELAVLLGPAPASEATTQPATRNDLRLLSAPRTSADGPRDPTAKPTESLPPPPPEGVNWLDVIGVQGGLVLLGNDEQLWRRDGRSWRVVASLPGGENVDIAAAGEGVLLVSREADEAVVRRLAALPTSDTPTTRPAEAWEEVARVPVEEGRTFRLVDGFNARVGGPAVLVFGEDDADQIVRDGQGGVVRWPEEVRRGEDDPRAAAFAAGAVRLLRASAGETENRRPEVYQIDLDPETLTPLEQDEAGVAVARELPLAGAGVRPLGGLVQIGLYLLLVLAFLGLVRGPNARPGVPATADAKAGPVLAPLRLRLAAAAIDLLPIAFAAALAAAGPPLDSMTAVVVVLLAGVVAYVALPLVGELLGGRSPGKAIFGLRVATPDGQVPPMWSLVTRNLLRPLDLLGGWSLILVHPQRRRVGDLAANTVVLHSPVGTPIK